MALKLAEDTEKRLIASIKRYYREQMNDEIGDLKASLLLEFFLREIGPSIYNRAIADAQAQMTEKVADLDGSCYHPEFDYWKKQDRT